jgi:murein tripeptide amidase MpaA
MLADAYASNAQFIPDIGRSLEDRAVSAIRIGDGSKPVVWFQCGIHAREWISPAAW